MTIETLCLDGYTLKRVCSVDRGPSAEGSYLKVRDRAGHQRRLVGEWGCVTPGEVQCGKNLG